MTSRAGIDGRCPELIRRAEGLPGTPPQKGRCIRVGRLPLTCAEYLQKDRSPKLAPAGAWALASLRYQEKKRGRYRD